MENVSNKVTDLNVFYVLYPVLIFIRWTVLDKSYNIHMKLGLCWGQNEIQFSYFYVDHLPLH
jgi:hypothetical protein